MKKITALVVLLSMAHMAMAQETVKIFVNSKAAGNTVAEGGENLSTVKIKKMKSALVKTITLTTSGAFSNNAMYKKTVQVMDGEVLLFTVAETKNAAGSFTLPATVLSKKLNAGKKIKLVLQLDPANDKMMMPSRIIPLCFMVMQ